MRKKLIKIISIFTLFLICIVSIQKISYATLQSKDKVVNTFNLGDIDVEVNEEFTPPKNWNGSEYLKKVQIKNKSKSQTLIRVSITPRWTDEIGNPWIGDTNLVKLNYKNTTKGQNEIGTNKWIYGDDNYYYYNSIVEKGKKTKILLESVEAKIPEDLKERYKNKTLVVDVKTEAIQATKDAYRKSWTDIENNTKIVNILDNLCIR